MKICNFSNFKARLSFEKCNTVFVLGVIWKTTLYMQCFHQLTQIVDHP